MFAPVGLSPICSFIREDSRDSRATEIFPAFAGAVFVRTIAAPGAASAGPSFPTRLYSMIRPILWSLFLLTAITLAPAAKAASPAEVYDDFEDRTLSKLWDTDRFEPGAVLL